MMRLWRLSYARKTALQSPALASAAAHVVLIGFWAVLTAPPDSMPKDSLANRVYYIPPPNRPPPIRGSTETVNYISFAEGNGAGPGPGDVDARRPEALDAGSLTRGHSSAPEPTDSTPAAAPTNPGNSSDSVYTILEVDSAVVRSQSSASPAYPLNLLAKHIEGSVTARYVVDTTGFADTMSFDVLGATNPGFVTAVRAALPYMQFSPAKIGAQKVRQLVEQSFTFRIAPTSTDSSKRLGSNPARAKP